MYQNQKSAGATQIIQNEEAIIKNDKLVSGLHAIQHISQNTARFSVDIRASGKDSLSIIVAVIEKIRNKFDNNIRLLNSERIFNEKTSSMCGFNFSSSKYNSQPEPCNTNNYKPDEY